MIRRLLFPVIICTACAAFQCASSSQSVESEPADRPELSEEIATFIIGNAATVSNGRIAVADFTDIDGNELEEGKVLAQQVTNILANDPVLEVIERSQLSAVLAEQQLSLTGVTEEQQQVGSILNVSAIVSGTIAHLESNEEIGVRMVDVETGTILCAGNFTKSLEERRSALRRMPAEQRERVSGEFDRREALRSKDKALYRAIQLHKKQLVSLRQNNPQAFDRVVRTVRKIDNLKRVNPKRFLLLTVKKDAPVTKNIDNSKIPQELVQLRKDLAFVVSHSPAYKKVLELERREIMNKHQPVNPRPAPKRPVRRPPPPRRRR